MDYDSILNVLGACGIHCGKCFAFKDGDIKHQSKKLKESLGHFDLYAERFITLLKEPTFVNYPAFKEFLNYLTNVSCNGCRKELNCKLFKDCNVKECAQEKKVDFCFQCDEFPCEKTNFDENLKARWISINQRMAKIGVEAYYKEIKDLPRY